ncbi:hypothetical protein EJ06DRAFT_49341 [Trichodelitschia bisporula]|uniref:Uncharacterized protein n=1 Tax=Trichodelitschia bisporula TaxID=703511 RepID=A0A6G1HUH0_9PEZI|nr:hypothetical protein EJ06DRAFT_49341 [Trichodelitschia bisporula]
MIRLCLCAAMPSRGKSIPAPNLPSTYTAEVGSKIPYLPSHNSRPSVSIVQPHHAILHTKACPRRKRHPRMTKKPIESDDTTTESHMEKPLEPLVPSLPVPTPSP